MFRIGFVVYLVLLSAMSYGQWRWVQGDSVNSDPVMGTKGVPHSANFPGGKYEASEWTDLDGNFWYFSGPKNGNDLWMYDPKNSEWTWKHGTVGTDSTNGQASFGVKTVPNVDDVPRYTSRTAVTWTDNNEGLWMFGSQSTNALWRYDIVTNRWTWMHGDSATNQSDGIYGIKGVAAPKNTPGERDETSCGWVDKDNNLWLFGGFGKDINGNFGDLNDLWKYNITANEWTWVNGSASLGAPTVYGEKGVAAPSNNPGARRVHANWIDAQGNLWLFGGYSNNVFFSDLWKYNPVTDMWTWIHGSKDPDSPGNYGKKCVSLPSNFPRARFENKAAWVDNCDNAWLFGGFGKGQPRLNDLWLYNSSNNEFTWISGDSISSEHAVYGKKGISLESNKPGGTFGNSYWKDEDGFWIYGGSTSTSGMDVLWKYEPDNATAEFAFEIDEEVLGKVNFTNSSFSACNVIKSYDWDFGVGGTLTDISSEADPSYSYAKNGTYLVKLVVTMCTGGKDSIIRPVNIENLSSTAFIPNSFTPNGDAVNEKFIPILSGKFSDYKLTIYNRWGGVLYETEDAAEGWDGRKRNKPVANGVYNYLLEYTDFSGNAVKENGNVSVIR